MMADAHDEDKVLLEFILVQLLRLGKILDFADEMGRRRMFTLLREMLIAVPTSAELIAALVDLLRIVSINERDFIRF